MYGPETFLARAADGGMAPWIEAGDFVWVDPDEPAVDGSVVLFGYGPEAVVRLLKVEDGRRTLRAVNGDWAEIVVDAGMEQGGRRGAGAERAVGYEIEAPASDAALVTTNRLCMLGGRAGRRVSGRRRAVLSAPGAERVWMAPWFDRGDLLDVDLDEPAEPGRYLATRDPETGERTAGLVVEVDGGPRAAGAPGGVAPGDAGCGLGHDPGRVGVRGKRGWMPAASGMRAGNRVSRKRPGGGPRTVCGATEGGE